MVFKKIKHYVSALDLFLAQLKERYPQPSCSQQKEMETHQRIAALRDNPTRAAQKNIFNF